VGETGLIRRLRPYLSKASAGLVVAAPDDDAAVWRSRRGLTVATVDTLVEGIDFRLEWRDFDFATLGRRLMTINLSDLAAMGAEPRHALVSLSLRPNLPVADVTALYRGIRTQARRYGFTVAGGDLSAIDGPLVLSATLFGELGDDRPMTRSGARRSWVLAVTGTLGKAAAGLQLLEARRRARTQTERRLIAAQLDPGARVRAGQILHESGITVAGDISDGLVREVTRMAEASHVGAIIVDSWVPLDPDVRERFGDAAALRMALGASEDFELICAAPGEKMASTQLRIVAETGLGLTAIGHVTPRRGVRRQGRDGKFSRVRSAGYEHFR
jgi:thiamine-monophosphate kinase